MSLSARDLRAGYDAARRVLDGVSCAFAGGRLTAVLGPNGAGKTTLLRCLLGVLKPEAGSVTLDSTGVGGLSRRDLARRVAYIPQRSSVAFAFSVREVVRLGRFAAGKGAGEGPVLAALKTAELLGRAAEPVGVLSAGQQQRVALARALAQLSLAGGDDRLDGRYLLADEPASAMDLRHSLSTLGLLRSLAARGLGVVVVLHDLSLIARYADDVVLLDEHGRVAAQGTVGTTLEPGVLRRVFGVEFEDLGERAGVGRVLVPVPPGIAR